MSQPTKYSELWDRLEPYAQKMLANITQPKKSGGGGADPYAIVLYDSDQQKIKIYSVTDVGLAGACAAAGSGDTIWLPACTISGDHVLAAGAVMVGVGRKKTILTGKVTLGAGAAVEKLTISRTGSSSAIAIAGPSSGTAYVINCDISVVLTGGTPLVVGTMGGDVQLLYSTITCTLNGVDANPFGAGSGYTGPLTWNFNDGAQGWVFTPTSGASGAAADGVLKITSTSGWQAGNWKFYTPGLKAVTGATFAADFVNGTNSFESYIIRYTDGTQDFLGSTLSTGRNTLTVTAGNNGKEVLFLQFEAETYQSTDTFDNATISGFDTQPPGGNVYVYACVMDSPYGIPLEGDRGAFDAAAYPALHTNDADASPSAIHHSLGTGANQAAAGNHGHSHTALTDIGTNTHAQIDTHLGSTANPHTVTKAQIGLGSVANILDKLDATTAPTINDDSGDGYAVGSLWVDVTADQTYICVDATVGAAVWVGASSTDAAAIHDNVAGEIAAITEKTTPADADVFLQEDSAASNAKKRVSWANIKATLKSYFDTLYAPISVGTWTTYTPTVTASSGTLTTVSATGLYSIIGKTVFVYITITLTTNGTGAGSINITLPTTQSAGALMIGRENSVTGDMCQGFAYSNLIHLFDYTGAYPGGDGRTFYISGVYRQP